MSILYKVPEILKKWLPYSFLLILLILLVQGFSSANKPTDFKDYYDASLKMKEKKDLYNESFLKELQEESVPLDEIFKSENLKKLESLKGNAGTYIYPPLFAFLLSPIAWNFSYEISGAVFFLINFICLCFSLFYIQRLLSISNFFPILSITLVVCFKFLSSHSTNNQVAFILILLILLAIYIKNDLLAGALLSLAIIIKITPAAFLFYFLYKKQWKRFGFSILFLGAWCLLPSVYDHDYNIRSLISWNDLILNNAMKNPAFRSWKNNQSLIATLAKYFLNTADPMNQMKYGLPFISLSQKTVQLLFYSITAITGISFLWKIKKGMSDAAILSSLFIFSAVFSGISWIHSFSVLIFPIIFITDYTLKNTTNRLNLFLCGVYIILTTLLVKQVIGSPAEGKLLMLSIYLYTSCLLYGIILLFDKKNAIS